MPKKKAAAIINAVNSTLVSVKQNRGFDTDFFGQDDALERTKWENVVDPAKMQKIITDILAPISLKNFELDMKKIQFVGLATEKYYDDSLATTVQYFDYESGGTVTRIIDLPHYPKPQETSAERIGSDLKKVIDKYGLADKIVSYSAADERRFFGDDKQQTQQNSQQTAISNNVFATSMHDIVKQSPFIGHRFTGYELRDVLFEALKTLPIDIEKQILAMERFFQERNYSIKLLADVEFFYRKEHPVYQQFYETAGWLSLAPAIDNFIANFTDLKYFFSHEKIIRHYRDASAFAAFFNNTRCLAYLQFVSEILKKLPQNFEMFEKNSKNIIGLMVSLKSAKTTVSSHEKLKTDFDCIPAKEKEPFEVEIKAFVAVFTNLIDKRLELYKDFEVLEWMVMSRHNMVYGEGKNEDDCLEFLRKHNISVNSEEMKLEFRRVFSFVLFKIQPEEVNNKPVSNPYDSCDYLSIDERWSHFFIECTRNKYPCKGLLKLIQLVCSITICADNTRNVHSALQKNNRWQVKADKAERFVFVDSLMLSSINLKTMTQTKLGAILKMYKHLL